MRTWEMRGWNEYKSHVIDALIGHFLGLSRRKYVGFPWDLTGFGAHVVLSLCTADLIVSALHSICDKRGQSANQFCRDIE